ncbi:MAG TPA: hypothetical protein PKO41_03450, partial [Dokdonella sp.]|nr:hypothetical protein [Dokdonella sp.]
MADKQLLRPPSDSGDLTRRELYFFNLYRVLEAVVYGGLVFSSLAFDWIKVSHPLLGRGVAVA